MSIEFDCEHCGSHIEVRFLKPGELALCQGCGRTVPVPEQPASSVVHDEPDEAGMHRVPDVIPETCVECSHFKRVGGSGSFIGYCRFYQRDTSIDWTCFALEAYPEAAAAVQTVSSPLRLRFPESSGPVGAGDSVGPARKLTVKGVEFECPVCCRDIVIWRHEVGDRAECPACGAPLTVPRNAQELVHDLLVYDDATDSLVAFLPSANSDNVSGSNSVRSVSPSSEGGVTSTHNTPATIGLVAGIVSVFISSFAIAPIVGIAFSGIGLAKADEYHSGRPQAWVGLCLGVVYAIIGLLNLYQGRF